MSRVDFYVLSADAPDARPLRVQAGQARVEQGCQVYIQTPVVQRLDDMLWTFSDGSFLPHEVYRGQAAAHARVMVMVGSEIGPQSHRALLIIKRGLKKNIEWLEQQLKHTDQDLGSALLEVDGAEPSDHTF